MLSSCWHGSLTATAAAAQLGLSRRRLYALSSEFLPARALQKEVLRIQGISGEGHAAVWPVAVTEILRKRLACSPPCPNRFVASEAFRLRAFQLDRAPVGHWAIQNDCAHSTASQRPWAPVRRWQSSQIGERWLWEASPHRWFLSGRLDFPMLNMLYDCSGVFVGCKIYDRDLLLLYLDCLPPPSWPTTGLGKFSSIITPCFSPKGLTR